MRKLASFDDPRLAQSVLDILHAEGIATDVRSVEGSGHALWIVLEADLARARSLLAGFTADPSDERFVTALRTAQAARTAAQPAAQRPRPRAIDLPQALRTAARRTPITFWMIVACVVVALATNLGDHAARVQALSIASYQHGGGRTLWDAARDLLQQGQLWRLWTPIFLHFGFFHLFFNVWCVIDLGAPAERQLGKAAFILFVLWTAAVSNLAQLYMAGPNFGGMSGVAYAMVGYHWAHQRFDPNAEIILRRDSFIFFGLWLLLGFTGALHSLVGGMANYCHLAGLLAGAAYGFLFSLPGARRLRS
ncbi:MAG TPA: rhomboid family intramembrane serine protease [Polyangiales bacterium]